MNFDQLNLDPRLMEGVRSAGYATPTPIQAAAIPPALAGNDLIGTAQTGTGKTAAFVLPILQRLLSGPRRRTRALIVTPTRELAEQINATIRALGSASGVRSATIYGGVPMPPQERALRDGVEILVACPGRLLDHIDQGNARLDGIEVLVLDEADRMFDMGFLPAVRRILKQVPAKRQTMLFSATFPPEIEQLAAQALRNPQRVAVGLTQPAATVTHALYPVPQHLKTGLTLELLKHTDTRSVLIFTRTRHRASRLARQLERSGYRVTSLHSDRTQNQRQAALDGFRNGTYQVMVATDIAARGIDVASISHVINYDIPDTADAYIHRIGRTGRAEREGDAFTLVTPEDDATVKMIERAVGQRIPRETIAGFDYSAPVPENTQFAGRSQQPRGQAGGRGGSQQRRPSR
ncbi:RNA helicase [Kouleothrix aurantiaca]|uniref:RNA helicase n=1 Tax=Kouleothrix aurantiaca TaxID=186479 RepID=A0A0P9HA31_9CHLR|nr:RNA helicase [Kouleothrix aurantiaca]